MRVLNCNKRYQTPLSSGGCIIERRDGMNYHLTPRGFIIIYIYEGILDFLSFNMPWYLRVTVHSVVQLYTV